MTSRAWMICAYEMKTTEAAAGEVLVRVQALPELSHIAMLSQAIGHRVWSVCLLNLPHVFFRHAATMHFDFGESSFDLTKIRRCELDINCS
jgi:hypothetical protein